MSKSRADVLGKLHGLVDLAAEFYTKDPQNLYRIVEDFYSAHQAFQSTSRSDEIKTAVETLKEYVDEWQLDAIEYGPFYPMEFPDTAMLQVGLEEERLRKEPGGDDGQSSKDEDVQKPGGTIKQRMRVMMFEALMNHEMDFLGWTQSDWANALGCSTSAVKKRNNASWKTFRKLQAVSKQGSTPPIKLLEMAKSLSQLDHFSKE